MLLRSGNKSFMILVGMVPHKAYWQKHEYTCNIPSMPKLSSFTDMLQSTGSDFTSTLSDSSTE